MKRAARPGKAHPASPRNATPPAALRHPPTADSRIRQACEEFVLPSRPFSARHVASTPAPTCRERSHPSPRKGPDPPGCGMAPVSAEGPVPAQTFRDASANSRHTRMWRSPAPHAYVTRDAQPVWARRAGPRIREIRHPSAITFTLRPANRADSDTLREPFLFQAQSNRIVPGVSQLRQTVRHPKDEEHGGINPQGDARIALLQPVESHAADKCPLRHDRRGNTATAARIPDVRAQFPQGPADGNRQCCS